MLCGYVTLRVIPPNTCSDLYIKAEGEKPQRKLHLHTRLVTAELELMTNTRYTIIVTNSRPGAAGSYVLSLTTKHSIRLEAIETPEPSTELAPQMLAKESPKKTGPCCYVSGKPVNFTSAHALSDHGFIFREHIEECKPLDLHGLKFCDSWTTLASHTRAFSHCGCCSRSTDKAQTAPICDICGQPITGKVASSKRTGKTMHVECAQQRLPQPQTQQQGQALERRPARQSGNGNATRPECSICKQPIMDKKFLSNADGERMHKSCFEQQTEAKRKICGYCGKPIRGNYVTGPCSRT